MLIKNDNIQRIGFISAITAMLMTIIFALALIIGFWAPIFSNILSYIVCFILAPAFVIMTISIHYSAPTEKKIFSSIGIAFAIIYAVFILVTYYTQLAFAFNPPNVPPEILQMFDYAETASWIFVVDMLGYSFMALSTLFIAFVFEKNGYEKWLRVIFIIHGIFFVSTLIMPLIPLGASSEESYLYGSIALIVWCLIFIPLSGLVAGFFWRKKNNKTQNEGSIMDEHT